MSDEMDAMLKCLDALKSERYIDRSIAIEKLVSIGISVVPHLEKVARSGLPHESWAATEVLRRLADLEDDQSSRAQIEESLNLAENEIRKSEDRRAREEEDEKHRKKEEDLKRRTTEAEGRPPHGPGSKEMRVCVRNVRAMCAGFVNLRITSEQGSALALDLCKMWNPQLYNALVETKSNVQVLGFSDSSMTAVINRINVLREKISPGCSVIIQEAMMTMADQASGPSYKVDAVLATFAYGRQPAVILADDMTLVPD